MADFYKERKKLPKVLWILGSFLEKISVKLNKCCGSNSVAIGDYLKSGQVLKDDKESAKKPSKPDEKSDKDDKNVEIKIDLLNKLMFVLIGFSMFVTFLAIWLAIIL